MNERKWIDIEPAESSLSAYEVSKKVVNLLRHKQTVQREMMERFNSGESRIFFRINFHRFLVGRMIVESMLGSRRRIKKKISILH